MIHPRHKPRRSLWYHQRSEPLSRQNVRSSVRRLPLWNLILAGVLLGGFVIGFRHVARVSGEMADSASRRAKALLPASMRRTKTPAE